MHSIAEGHSSHTGHPSGLYNRGMSDSRGNARIFIFLALFVGQHTPILSPSPLNIMFYLGTIALPIETIMAVDIVPASALTSKKAGRPTLPFEEWVCVHLEAGMGCTT